LRKWSGKFFAECGEIFTQSLGGAEDAEVDYMLEEMEWQILCGVWWDLRAEFRRRRGRRGVLHA
jgi:predicted protein tyrosine phosphatase